MGLRAAQLCPARSTRARWRVPSMSRAPRRAATQAVPPASLRRRRRRVKTRGVAWYTTGWGHTTGGEHGYQVARPALLWVRHARAGRPTQRPEGSRWADMGTCAACQQAAAVAALPVLTAAAGQQTLWHPIRDAERLATYRATAGPLPAWWDRCVATAPARVCPCGSYRLRWGEDEAT